MMWFEKKSIKQHNFDNFLTYVGIPGLSSGVCIQFLRRNQMIRSKMSKSDVQTGRIRKNEFRNYVLTPRFIFLYVFFIIFPIWIPKFFARPLDGFIKQTIVIVKKLEKANVQAHPKDQLLRCAWTFASSSFLTIKLVCFIRPSIGRAKNFGIQMGKWWKNKLRDITCFDLFSLLGHLSAPRHFWDAPLGRKGSERPPCPLAPRGMFVWNCS